MSKKAFDRISEGLNEAIGIARGTIEPAALHVPVSPDTEKPREPKPTGVSEQTVRGSLARLHQPAWKP
jgi:hypothetical protein